MSDSDTDSGVLVERESVPDLLNEAEEPPRALQIVSVETVDDVAVNDVSARFRLHAHHLESILNRCLSQKVAVVSVVGAFHTGKSFLLSWFLHYLSFPQHDENGQRNDSVWYQNGAVSPQEGFEWKAGSERNTTGIWMWSHPFVVNDMDILLVDTQGMFDHETSMALTASIFGFSTLLSSYQIYNVDKRIQEDHLQQLALFSEYARTAVASEEKSRQDKTEIPSEDSVQKPFQYIEFLVRDWQHFEEDEEDLETMEKAMEEYLEKVLQEREAKDLKDTRDQITSCFEEIGCYGLCHPGFAVTKSKFTGDPNDIDDLFLKLLDRYCQRVFSNLKPKTIHGRGLTARELGVYTKAYAELFTSGAQFPTAATLLEATASANNTNAVHMAHERYKSIMDRVSGPKCSNYLRPDELKDEHKSAVIQSLLVFDEIANFGNKDSIRQARDKVIDQAESDFVMYSSLNDSRNPLAGLETYIIPLTVGILSAILRWITDLTCSAKICRAGSEIFSHTYAFVFSFLFIIALTKFKQIKDAANRFYKALEILADGGKAKKE